MIPELGLIRPGVNIMSRKIVALARKKTAGGEETQSSWPPYVIVEDGKHVGTAGREVADAVDLAKDTLNTDSLERFLAEEKRPQVVKAINDQIKVMNEVPSAKE